MRNKLAAALVAAMSLLGMVYANPAGAYDSNEVTEVNSWYTGMELNPDSGGVAYWANRYDGHNDVGCGSANRASASHDIRSFMAATGKMNSGTTNTWKTIYAYRVVLGRYPDAGGLNYWVGRLNSGTSWQTMVHSMVYSSEYYSTKVNGGAWDFVPC